MKIKILLFFLLIFSSKIYSQVSASYSNQLPKDIKSPGVSDFVREGNIEVNSYIGETSYSIPLVSVPVNGQNNINVSLGYNSAGFNPTKKSGLVGLNWHLSIGGSINREVNNYPDDHIGQPECVGCGTNQNGLLVGVRDRVHNTNDVFNYVNTTGSISSSRSENWLLHGSGNTSSKKYEASPDTFNFNFNGISGKFFIGIDGEIKVITNSPESLKVDLTGVPNQPYVLSCKPLNSEIKITDSKGNIYFFGGETKALEYNINLGTISSGAYVSRPVINSWHLTKIEYYNGYVVTYNFKDDSALSDYLCREDGQRAHLFNYNDDSLKDFVSINEIVSDERYLSSYNSNLTGGGGPTKTYQIHKKAILDMIIGADFTIKLNYSRQPFPIYEGTSYSFTSIFKPFKELRLDNLELKNSMSFTIKYIEFNYSVLGAIGKKRNMLSSINSQNEQIHSFEYYYNAIFGFPTYSTFGIDHWGYWNGKTQTTTLIPNMTYNNTTGDYTFSSGNVREPSFNYALQGQLKKIIYPTKGYSEFIYEAHSYSKVLERKSTSAYMPVLSNTSGTAGGTRIKSVINYDGNQLETKNYLYSGGIMMKWPRYTLYVTGVTNSIPSGWYNGVYFGGGGNVPVGFGYIKSNPMNINSGDSEVITYSQVTEDFNGNGKIVRKFSDYESNPDIGVDGVDYKYFQIFNYYTFDNPQLEKNSIGIYLNDMKIERGKIKWEKIYNSSNNLIEETLYDYNVSPGKFNLWTVSMHQTGTYSQSNKMYYYPNYLTKKTVKNYLNSSIVENVFEYEYDATNNNLLSEKHLESNSDITETRYSYTYISQNNLRLLTGKSNFKNNNKLFEEKIEYGNNTDVATFNRYLPKKILSSKFPNSNPTVSGVTLLDLKVNFHRYDNKGNPVEVSLENDKKSVYIWGYNKSHIVAKIDNISYADLANALGVTTTQLLDFSENNLLSINQLRTNPLMVNSFITTYEYIPLIGLISITDPKGKAKFFKYDKLQRLSYVLDEDGNVMSENLYHFKN